ncbi:MAG: enamine deaminase RidA [Sneathiella sp.]|jgi:enamine deaminase RidA (YjgF/YER057c/UK114 family)|uniref:RidA family protein n=1 Tax=Sneathiella sp. TaxID=1964365 RepID=UPI000C64D307|nr:RidA family protein [Sneathiella sp.]MAL77874.1 enamine deaminase RidA [Sneathiella sp.]|tara:strand:+ start:297 stop:698 length:402 start_codon:yes stop_codon:yes gene_type:complete
MNKFLNPDNLATPSGYSHVAVSTGSRIIHVSGQVSYDSAGNIVGVGDLKKQTEQVYENIGRALEAAGATFADVVKSIILIKQMTPEKVITVRDVRQNYLTDTPPTSTLISVDTLIKPELLVEIEVVAIPADDR